MLGLGGVARRLFGTTNDRKIKAMMKTVARINALEPEFEALSDEGIRQKTEELRTRHAGGEALDALLPEAFANVREAAKRALGLRPFDVQLLGGMVLHGGGISEMKTGEGKTLVATLPVYLNAITGRGVHVVTVNDYLARRDAEWMGRVYETLGLTTGVIVPGLEDQQRREAYACDVTYATNNELGFDYLRDNMKYRIEDMVQRGHAYAIVDEVDSILIDEARTPLIISGPVQDQSALYTGIDKIIPSLTEEDYELDEKTRQTTLTEEGNERVEQLLHQNGLLEADATLYDPSSVTLVHHVQNALRAHKVFQKDRDYIVKNGKVVIIDEFTGRMMEGRRWGDGLHQAVEAKEGVQIQPENVTMASVTFQNYFRLYEKLAGMTGTAMTEAGEFAEIYGLEVTEIPTNRPMIRNDEDDQVFRTAAEKYAAIVEAIKDGQSRGQPILVGTVSIEKSEMLSALLTKEGIQHQVLNARYHEQEAYIVAQAGVPGTVTIATNMAGRGTDIQLGGNPEMRAAQEAMDKGIEDEAEIAALTEKYQAEAEALKKQALDAGGLWVIASERHESRRIDNQLRGRSGRQGDPGRSSFFLSLDDDLMRIFGSGRIDGILQKLGLEEGEAIVHPWVNKAIERAQGKVEARNFDIRKNILKFDDVMNDQRKAIFEQRRELMEAEDISEDVASMRHQIIDDLVARHIPAKAYADQWDAEGLEALSEKQFGIRLPVTEWASEEGVDDEVIRERIIEATDAHMAAKEEAFGAETMRQIEKQITLQILDQHWRDHLVMLEHLRSVIGLRGYAQRDPLNEYKSEAFQLFEGLLGQLRTDVTMQLAHVRPVTQEEIEARQRQMEEMRKRVLEEQERLAAASAAVKLGDHSDPAARPAAMPAVPGGATAVAEVERDPTNPETWGKVGRNEPCPCGSGKKYKHCHGKL